MSNVWFTSDLHISHRFVASTRTHWVDRPGDWMGSTDWHDEYLALQWDSNVGKHDVVYVCGDICGGTDKSYLNALRWIQERPGRKVLIHGNHDPINGLHRESTKWGLATSQAFESNHAYLRRRIGLLDRVGGHQDVVMSHFPYTDEFTGIGHPGRYTMYRLHDEGVPIIHGHTHSNRKVTTSSARVPYIGADGLLVEPRTLQLHVGVDAWNGSPVPLDWVQEQVQGWVRVIAPPEPQEAVQP